VDVEHRLELLVAHLVGDPVPGTASVVDKLEPNIAGLGHYWPPVPDSPRIGVYIAAYPPKSRIVEQTRRSGFPCKSLVCDLRPS